MGKLYYQDKAGDIKVTSKGIPSPTDETAVAEALNEQSETLFKTINGQSITGEGNIEVGGGSVIANPEMEGDEPDLTGIEIDGNKYKIPEGGGNVDSLIANAVIRLQETTNNFVIQTPDGVLSDLDDIGDFLYDNMNYLLIVSVVDSNNMPAAMLAPFMYDEIEDGIALLLATPYGSINVDIVRPQGTTNFYVDWSQYSKGSNINTTCSYYVENSTKRAVPVVKFIDCLSDAHNPRIYNADEFYALVQEAYAEYKEEHTARIQFTNLFHIKFSTAYKFKCNKRINRARRCLDTII